MAAPSTVNNDVKHYNNATFDPTFQLFGFNTSNGWWNPNGDHRFEFACRATSLQYGDGTSTVGGADPALGFRVESVQGYGRYSAKIVDLDPQQQGVSMLFGLDVAIRGATGSTSFLRGSFRPTVFTDLWGRRGKNGGDEGLSVMYQSVLESLTWGDLGSSRFLQELQAAATDGLLSIRFNLDGYSMSPTSPDGAANPKFTKGRIVGTIGPALGREPRHFVPGRHLAPTVQGVNFSVAVVDEKAGKLRLDLGNSLPVNPNTGGLLDLGALALGYQPSGNAAVNLGNIQYMSERWYEKTAGIVDLPEGRSLSAAELGKVRDNPLVLITSPPGAAHPAIIASEAADGVHVRADLFVTRLNSTDKASFDFYASRFGRPLPAAQIDLVHQKFGSPDEDEPPMGIPQSALAFPPTIQCDANGHGTVTLTASDPGNPRKYIDGQVYFVLYVPRGADHLFNRNDFLSVLVWNSFVPDNPPTWYGSMEQIFRQYGNLYPIMRDNPDIRIDLTKYEVIAANWLKISNTLKLQVTDPHYMPVTRDLSDAKRLAMIQWLTNLGPDGKPLLGTRVGPPTDAPAVKPIGSKVLATRKLNKLRLAPEFPSRAD